MAEEPEYVIEISDNDEEDPPRRRHMSAPPAMRKNTALPFQLPDTPYDVHMRTRDRTPDLAAQTFEGDFEVVRANKVQTRFCSRQLFNFMMSAMIVSFVTVAALIYLLVMGFDSPGAPWLQTIIAFCVGVFMPQPAVEAKLKSRFR